MTFDESLGLRFVHALLCSFFSPLFCVEETHLHQGFTERAPSGFFFARHALHLHQASLINPHQEYGDMVMSSLSPVTL